MDDYGFFYFKLWMVLVGILRLFESIWVKISGENGDCDFDCF